MKNKKKLFDIFTQDVVYNYHIIKTEEPNGHLVYLIKNGSEINEETLEFSPTVIVEKLISKCGVTIEKFAPSIFFTEEDNTEKLNYELGDKLSIDSEFSTFIESVKDEYRILEVKDSLLFKKDPEEYERVKQAEHEEQQKDLWDQYGKQVENQNKQREDKISSYDNDLIKLLKEYFSGIIEYEKRDFNFDNELKKIVGSLADVETWIKIDEKPFICNVRILSLEQDKLNVLLTDNSIFYTATLRFDKTILITENVVKIEKEDTLPVEMTDYDFLAQLYDVDFTSVKDWEFKNEIERFEYTIDYLAPIFKLEIAKEQQEMVEKVAEKYEEEEKKSLDEDEDDDESNDPYYNDFKYDDDEEIVPDKTLTPKNYYFDVHIPNVEMGPASISLVNVDFWNREHCLDDRLGSHSINNKIISALNNAGIYGDGELMEAIWEVTDKKRTEQDIIDSMVKQGFIYNNLNNI